MSVSCDVPKVANTFLQLSSAKCRNHTVLLPFLYQTATIQRRSFRTSPGNDRVAGWADSEDRPRNTPYRRLKLGHEARPHQHHQQQHEQLPAQSPSSQTSEHDRYFAANPSAPPSPDSRPKRDSTITDLERNTFTKLFRSLAREEEAAASSKSPSFSADDAAALSLVDEVSDPDADPGGSSLTTGDYDVDVIIARELNLSAPNIAAYPAVLQELARDTETRVAAARATQERRRRMEEAEPGTLEARRITKGIAIGLKSARTDAQVWKVLEEQVFVHVKALPGADRVKKADRGRGVNVAGVGPGVVEEMVEVQKRARGKKRAKGQAEHGRKAEDEVRSKGAVELGYSPLDPEVDRLAAQTSEESVPSAPAPMDLRILRRVYPASLLLAVRILANRTHDTPFLPALLPTIRTLHPLSLILGASTALYNELLKYTWRTTSSIFSVLNLLEDMSNIGLSMDVQTWEILERITLYRYRAMRGDFGNGVAALENMAKRKDEGQRLWKWKADIRKTLQEIQLGKAQSVVLPEESAVPREIGSGRMRSADGAETIRYHAVI